jgi:hypothetical protein
MAGNLNGISSTLVASNIDYKGAIEPPLTICCWARRTAASSGTAVSLQTTGGTHRYILQYSTASGNVWLAAIVGTAGASAISVPETQGQWAHICGVFSAIDNRSIYINGVIGGTNTTSSVTTGITELCVGARRNTTLGIFFTGDVAEVGVWNVALTQAEITALSSGVSPNKIRPQNLISAPRLIRDFIDPVSGKPFTNTAVAPAPHPRSLG